MRSSQQTCQTVDKETEAWRRQEPGWRRGQETGLPPTHALRFLNHTPCNTASTGRVHLQFNGIKLTEMIVFLSKANFSAITNDEYVALIRCNKRIIATILWAFIMHRELCDIHIPGLTPPHNPVRCYYPCLAGEVLKSWWVKKGKEREARLENDLSVLFSAKNVSLNATLLDLEQRSCQQTFLENLL